MNSAKKSTYAPRRWMLAWHRRIGLAAAVVILLVVVTGIPLNHAEKLGLNRKAVTNETALGWYGIGLRDKPLSYRIGDSWLTVLGNFLYLDSRHFAETAGPVVGAAPVGNLFVLATPQELFLYAKDGSLVEKLAAAGLPRPVMAIGVTVDGGVVVQTPSGPFSGVAEFLEWTPSKQSVRWTMAEPTPPELKEKIVTSYRGGGLPWSRVLLDIHTGRILGRLGPYLIDVAALCLIFLVGTGIFNALACRR